MAILLRYGRQVVDMFNRRILFKYITCEVIYNPTTLSPSEIEKQYHCIRGMSSASILARQTESVIC
jgi:hypothetical protein